MTREHELLERKLLRQIAQTSKRWGLLEDGDKVMVAISGGKDSYTMLQLLTKLAARLPFAVELIAVHLDQQQPGYDGRPLVEWLDEAGVAYEILSEDTYSVVTSHLDEASTYCSMCSRLRRGILYTAAERIGCNKIALGHHRGDTLETFLMNLFYAGKLQAMPARYTTDDDRFVVVRPMIECAESEIARYAELEAFPILPCNLCGSQSGLKRDEMTALLDRMEAEHPNVRAVMLNALRNVRATHLLDPAVSREPEEKAPPATKRHAPAEPVREERGPPPGPPLNAGTRASSAAVDRTVLLVRVLGCFFLFAGIQLAAATAADHATCLVVHDIGHQRGTLLPAGGARVDPPALHRVRSRAARPRRPRVAARRAIASRASCPASPSRSWCPACGASRCGRRRRCSRTSGTSRPLVGAAAGVLWLGLRRRWTRRRLLLDARPEMTAGAEAVEGALSINRPSGSG